MPSDNQMVPLWCYFYDIINKKSTYYSFVLIICPYSNDFPSFSLTNECHLAKVKPWFPLFFYDINIGILYAYLTLSSISTRIIIHINNSYVRLLLWNYKHGIDILAPLVFNTVFNQVISNSFFLLRDAI